MVIPAAVAVVVQFCTLFWPGVLKFDNRVARIFQCADIFYLQADICQLGMDQRKVNMLAREFVEEKRKQKDSKSSKSSNKIGAITKPVILSHPMLPGLLEGQEKMSKSNPDSAIFMEDTEAVSYLHYTNLFFHPRTCPFPYVCLVDLYASSRFATFPAVCRT